MLSKRSWLVIGVAAVLLIGTGRIISCASEPESGELLLSDYTQLFEREALIVVGQNASQIELDSAESIAVSLEGLAGNEPITKTDSEVSENDMSDHNLILVGTPDTNDLLHEVYSATNATRVTEEYPGENKVILEILRSPWNRENALLLIAGSDEWGVKVGSLVLEDAQDLEDKGKIIVDWEEYTGIALPIDNAEEAIGYARTDIDVRAFLENWSSQGYNVNAHAKLWSESNHWFVQFHVVAGVEEIWFSLEIDPSGIIIHKGGTL